MINNWRSWLTIIFGVAISIIIIATSDAFQTCMKEHHGNEAQQAVEKGLAFIISMLRHYKGCSGHFLEKNAEPLIAIFTVVLAISTILLWKTTADLLAAGDKQIEAAIKTAEATERSARAIIGTKLPLLRIRPDSLSHGETSDGEDVSVYQVWLFNNGETKAFPVEILYGFTVGEVLPDKPVYRFLSRFPINEIVEPKEELATTIRLQQGEPLKSGDWGKICKGNYLWFYCQLHYRDFMDERRTHAFCFKWAYVGMGVDWRVDETLAYNQKT